MLIKHTSYTGLSPLVLALFSCLLAGPLFARQKHYQEAHVYITGPSALSATVSLAVEVVRPMFLSDRGFQTFESTNPTN